jgi:hypothetical protein
MLRSETLIIDTVRPIFKDMNGDVITIMHCGKYSVGSFETTN